MLGINSGRDPRNHTAVFPSKRSYDNARERGRAMAAQALKADPEKRREMEAEYGVSACRLQYPEAYGLKKRPVIVLP